MGVVRHSDTRKHGETQQSRVQRNRPQLFLNEKEDGCHLEQSMIRALVMEVYELESLLHTPPCVLTGVISTPVMCDWRVRTSTFFF